MYVLFGLFVALLVGFLVGFQLLLERWQYGSRVRKRKSGKPPANETDSQILTHFPTWVRGFGGFLILMGVGFLYGALTLLGKDTIKSTIFICLGPCVLLSGTWIVGYNFSVSV